MNKTTIIVILINNVHINNHFYDRLCLSKYPNLTRLDLSGNRFAQLPPGTTDLTQLVGTNSTPIHIDYFRYIGRITNLGESSLFNSTGFRPNILPFDCSGSLL